MVERPQDGFFGLAPQQECNQGFTRRPAAVPSAQRAMSSGVTVTSYSSCGAFVHGDRKVTSPAEVNEIVLRKRPPLHL